MDSASVSVARNIAKLRRVSNGVQAEEASKSASADTAAERAILEAFIVWGLR
jgi:hypothetical protein